MDTPIYSNLNAELMATKIGLKPKHIPMLVGSFVDESHTILASLKKAIEAMDFEAIRMQAHSIKGSSGNLKFDELYEIAKSMEFAAKDSDATYDYHDVYRVITDSISSISLA